MKRLAVLAVSIMVAFVFLSGVGAAKDKADATLELEQGQVAVGIGFSWGEGVLTYNGKKYPVKVDGISVVDVGITKAAAKGNVYNLKKIEDFDGNYTAVTAEGTLGGGTGATKMKNEKGVMIELITMTKGVNLKLATSGVGLKLKK